VKPRERSRAGNLLGVVLYWAIRSAAFAWWWLHRFTDERTNVLN
jgi:hypothetical protein